MVPFLSVSQRLAALKVPFLNPVGPGIAREGPRDDEPHAHRWPSGYLADPASQRRHVEFGRAVTELCSTSYALYLCVCIRGVGGLSTGLAPATRLKWR